VVWGYYFEFESFTVGFNHDGGKIMSLDERQETVLRTFTREQLEGMPLEDVVKLVGEAGPNAKLKITALVKRADGSIKYDAGAIPGDYNETPEELQAHADRELELNPNAKVGAIATPETEETPND
jgi:hypothetical protein